MYRAQVGRSAPGVWDSDLVLNQSLSGLVNRFAQAGLPWSLDRLPSGTAALAPKTVASIRWLTYGISLALLALTAWRFGRPDASRSSHHVGAEAAAIVCLMLLLSPMSSKAHYVVLVLPCMLFARALIERRHAAFRLLLPFLLITGPLTSKGLTGKPLGDLTLAWGFPTWFALMLLAAMWLLLPAAWAKVSLAAQPERRPAERAA
jgi:hypothetical protein